MSNELNNAGPEGYAAIDPEGDLALILSASHLEYLSTTSDETGVVLRAHLVAEEALNIWIVKITGSPGIFNRGFFAFATKLQMALNLGLPRELGEAFTNLNDLRNRFAHRITAATDGIQSGDLAKLKNSVEAIPAEALGTWGTAINQGAPKNGTVHSYMDPSTTAAQRISIIFDVLVMKIVIVYQIELARRRISLRIA